jgi:hypothetical protein
MKTKLRMKCRNCGRWNRFEVEGILGTSNLGGESEGVYPYVSTFQN